MLIKIVFLPKMVNQNKNILFNKLNDFIIKYYQNQLIRGGIYVGSISIIFFLLFTIIEYFSGFGVGGRTILFWTYILVNFIVFIKLILIPILNLCKIGNTLNYKEAAKIIGNHFSEIDDQLLNILELSEISKQDTALINASINQKTKIVSRINFKNAIDFSVNKKHLKWILIPLSIILFFFISGQDHILTESSARIIRHNTFFEPKSPFSYVILNKNLTCVQFEDFLLKIKVKGNQIPNDIYLRIGKNSFKMTNTQNNCFEYKFTRIHSDLDFKFYGGGYLSERYTVKALLQPKIVDIKITISHPKHTNKKQETINNNGDITVSEGGLVYWNIKLENTKNTIFKLGEKLVTKTEKSQLNVNHKISKSSEYSIIISNPNELVDTTSYFINVIKDESPKINLTQVYDTSNNRYVFNGVIEDDYLIEKLEFIYSYASSDSTISSLKELQIERKNIEQFFYTKTFNDLNLEPGKEVKYFFRVWDNDGVNGSKFTSSQTFTHKEISLEEFIDKKDLKNKKIKNSIDNSIGLAESIQDKITDLNKTILEKKKLGWEEKEKVNEIINSQKKLEEEIKKTQKNNSENIRSQKKLNSKTLEKQKQLENLINKVLDDEMKDLLKEMEEIINKADKEKLKDLLEKIKEKNIDLEKELERDLEIFKQLEFEQKTEETLNKIAEVKKEQEKLKKETEQKESKTINLIKKQESINFKMEDVNQNLDDLRQKNEKLENKHQLPETKKTQDDINTSMQNSQNALEKGKKKKSSKSQNKAIEEIEKLEKQLQKMQQSSSENSPVEDMETLRKVLENLVTLSFDQEELMLQVKNTPRNSSEFIKIVQKQNKLSDDSKIIEDSLFALSKRVVSIEATINKEITSIKYNIENATKELEARSIKKGTKRQQYVMTSINNLALLLSEILEQMQKQLEMPSSKCNKSRNCNKPNPNCNKPSMSELKKAQKRLNEKLKKGKNGEKGKQGKKTGESKSKELLHLAKSQNQIRKQLIEMRNEIGKNGEKGKIDKILEEMEKNEIDIVNNRITQETINRQKQILSRLLETNISDREQDEDDKREANEWNYDSTNLNKEFLDYQKQKETQEELLKTTPLQLNPFYKKKVQNYFKSILND